MLRERRVVEQRDRVARARAASSPRASARRVRMTCQGVGAVDVLAAACAPTPRAGWRRRASKSSANTASVAALIAPAEVPQTMGNGFSFGLPRMSRTALTHADLIGGARAAAGQHQPRARLACGWSGTAATLLAVAASIRTGLSWPRGALASATASAVMLTMRRTVADGVRMCTGRAAPSRIGPMVTPPPRGGLQQVEGDVGGVERRHDEQVGFAAQPRVAGTRRRRISSDSAASPCISPSTSSSGARCADQLERLAHLARGGRV